MYKKVLGVALSAAFFISPSFADDSIFIDIVAGLSKQETKTDFNRVNRDYSDDTAYSTIRVSKKVLSDIGVEISYSDFGEMSGNKDIVTSKSNVISVIENVNFSADASMVAVGVVGYVPFLNDKLVLVGRAGVAQWDFSLNVDRTAVQRPFLDQNTDGVDVYGVIGLHYYLSDHLYVGAEFSSIEMSVDSLTEHSLDNLGVYVGYGF